jgi:formylglycine-generating enzyme
MIKFVFIHLLLISMFTACTGNKSQNNNAVHPESQANKNIQSQEKEELPANAEIPSGTVTAMIYFEGGTFTMGSETGLSNERPTHQVKIEPFFIDKHPVTVAQFRKFTEATGYKTEAEKFGDSGIFSIEKQTWELIPGTTWQKPFGPSGPDAEADHPVTHVSWNDAVAFAKWAGKRLPTEAEWEYAARSGKNSGNKFSWGNEVSLNGQYLANIWQGEINAPLTTDGYLFTSPVGIFGENEAGLTDMGGNVWQWCADVYKPYPGSAEVYRINPDVKVIRSGSFFFDQNGENSFSVSGRSMNSHETSLFNTGFRCAKSATGPEN